MSCQIRHASYFNEAKQMNEKHKNMQIQLFKGVKTVRLSSVLSTANYTSRFHFLSSIIKLLVLLSFIAATLGVFHANQISLCLDLHLN